MKEIVKIAATHPILTGIGCLMVAGAAVDIFKGVCSGIGGFILDLKTPAEDVAVIRNAKYVSNQEEESCNEAEIIDIQGEEHGEEK